MQTAIALTVLFWWWCPGVVSAWNITRLYGTPMRARLTDVAVWRNRAYACWPRLDAAQPVTLLELPWPESDQHQQSSTAAAAASTANWKPSRPFYADQQKLDDCRCVQSAVALDLDRIRGHLYVLDSGYADSNGCRPKIVVYDLRTVKYIQSMELGGLTGSELSTLAVDARPFKGGTRVYVGNARGGRIAVFDPDLSVWYRVTLNCADREREETDDDVPAECMAVSKLHLSVFLTSTRSHNLYSASLRDLRNLTSYVSPSVKNGDVLPVGLRVHREGVKLGRSGGLYVDIQGGLNYVYTRDFVAVRLSPGVGVAPAAAITAKDHKVLLQSYELLPAVTKIFTDSTNYLQVWALNVMPNAENRHAVKINTLTINIK